LASPLLRTEMTLLLALFLACLTIAPIRRDRAVQLLVAAIALKIGLHAVTVMQGRYFLVVTALQMLVIALGVREAGRLSARRLAVALAISGAAATGLALITPRAMAAVAARDVDFQRSYRFPLAPSLSGPAVLDCSVERGRLVHLSPTGVTIATFEPEPSPGEIARADCIASAPGPLPPVVIRLHDPYAPGGSPGRVEQRVVLDGREVFPQDLSDPPESGWFEIPLGELAPGARKTISIEVVALRPDPGDPWGSLAATRFELAPAAEKP
jgi:hypothetical protein